MLNLKRKINSYSNTQAFIFFLLYVEGFELKDKSLPSFDSSVLIDQPMTMHRATNTDRFTFFFVVVVVKSNKFTDD